jgi:hypothetical protein
MELKTNTTLKHLYLPVRNMFAGGAQVHRSTKTHVHATLTYARIHTHPRIQALASVLPFNHTLESLYFVGSLANRTALPDGCDALIQAAMASERILVIYTKGDRGSYHHGMYHPPRSHTQMLTHTNIDISHTHNIVYTHKHTDARTSFRLGDLRGPIHVCDGTCPYGCHVGPV